LTIREPLRSFKRGRKALHICAFEQEDRLAQTFELWRYKRRSIHLERPLVVSLQSLLGRIQIVVVIQVHSSIVDQDIYSSLLLFDLLDQLLDLVTFGDIQSRVVDFFFSSSKSEIFAGTRTRIENDRFGGGKNSITDGCSDASVLRKQGSG
jgi:hypothetical protein